MVCLLQVDDCLVTGPNGLVVMSKEAMLELFDCDDVGEMKEHVGCKVDWDKDDDSIQITQPALMKASES